MLLGYSSRTGKGSADLNWFLEKKIFLVAHVGVQLASTCLCYGKWAGHRPRPTSTAREQYPRVL